MQKRHHLNQAETIRLFDFVKSHLIIYEPKTDTTQGLVEWMAPWTDALVTDYTRETMGMKGVGPHTVMNFRQEHFGLLERPRLRTNTLMTSDTAILDALEERIETMEEVTKKLIRRIEAMEQRWSVAADRARQRNNRLAAIETWITAFDPTFCAPEGSLTMEVARPSSVERPLTDRVVGMLAEWEDDPPVNNQN